MDKSALLEKFSFYQRASQALRKTIEIAAKPANLAAGVYLYHEGDRSDYFALVGAGSIRVFKTAETGNEITLYHVQDGQACLVNMLCVFLNRPTMAIAIVESPTEALTIPAALFRQWVATERIIREFVFESIASRLVDVMVLVEELAFRKMDERLARLLLDRFSGESQPNVIATTHDEMARELGTAREVVSRLLKELERARAVRITRGRIELLDEAALFRASGGLPAETKRQPS